MAMRTTAAVVVTAGFAGFIATQVKDSAPTSALGMQFAEIGTHPRADALLSDGQHYSGAELRDLAISGGKLYAGYGDWNSNSDSWGPSAGRTALVPFDIASRTFESQNEVMIGSEAILNIREINGALYIPTIDPSIHGSGGYATNESGSWVVHNVIPDAVHVFDVANLVVSDLDGSDLWLFGARDNYVPGDDTVGRAVAWRSIDGGATWQEEYSDGSDPGQGAGFERYYWGQKVGSKLFIHAAGTVPESPMRSFDGASWQDYGYENRCDSAYNRVVTFNNTLVCGTGYIDGGYVEGLTVDQNGVFAPLSGLNYIVDFYEQGGYLYALDSQGTISRTTNLVSWQEVGTFTQDSVGATSLAVYNDHVYIGTSNAKIYESTLAITDNLAIGGVETCFVTNGNEMITGYYDNENDNPANPLCSRDVVIPDEINGNTITTIGSSAFYGLGITSVVIPETITTINDAAFYDNDIVSIDLPDALTTLGTYAFSRNQLESVSVPDGISRLNDGVFSQNRLTSIALPDAMDRILDYALEGNLLTSIDLPDSLILIRGYALSNNKITTVDLPDGLVSIGEGVFKDNLLTSLVLPDSVTQVLDQGFSNNLLTSLSLSDGMTSISPSAFSDNRLQQVTIPNSITSVDDTAFMGQSMLKEPAVEDDYEMDSLNDNGEPTFQEYLDSIWYTRLYTQDPSNPNGLTDGVFVKYYDETECQVVDSGVGDVSAQSGCGNDYNSDGDSVDMFHANYGGHLVNPAYVDVRSETKQNQEVAETVTLSGKSGDEFIAGYLVKDGPVLEEIEEEVAPWGVGTLAVNANTVMLGDSYFRVGQTIQIPASMLPGYRLAPGSSPLVTITLTAAVNSVTFLYELTSPAAPGAPNSGVGSMLALTGAVVVAFAAGSLVVYRRLRRKAA